MLWTKWQDGRRRALTTARLANAILNQCQRPSRYLEIGVAQGETFVAVDAEFRSAVDPLPQDFVVPGNALLHRMSSRDYFSGPLAGKDGPFDVVFVDGLHLWEEALEDTLSAFDHLKAGGYVIVDDVYPSGYWEGARAESYREAVDNAEAIGQQIVSWMGDVWKAVYLLAHSRVPGLSWVTVPVTTKRFHTVFWWSAPPLDETRSLRTLLDTSLSKELEGMDAAILGDFAADSIPDFYRVKTFREVSSDLRSGLMQAF